MAALPGWVRQNRRVGKAALVKMPTRRRAAIEQIGRRVGFGVGLVLFIATVVTIQRNGYQDSADGAVSVLDALYYASVSVTTTGYGDITPVSDAARLVDVLLVTPARLMFLVLLVGTTMEVLTDQSRHALATRRWRKRVNDHYIICGYGSTGRSAIRALRAQGVGDDRFVVIEPDPGTADDATADGLVTVVGDASATSVLRSAEIDQAAAVVVTPNRDDTAVLVTLTARELRPTVTIVAGVRNEENLHLLRQSGADSVIHSADAVGRLLGLATTSQPVAKVLDDLMLPGSGLDVVETDAVQLENGRWGAPAGTRALAIVRDGDQYDIDDTRPIEQDDRLVVLRREA
jgi:voltage-gated potassium channel